MPKGLHQVVQQHHLQGGVQVLQCAVVRDKCRGAICLRIRHRQRVGRPQAKGRSQLGSLAGQVTRDVGDGQIGHMREERFILPGHGRLAKLPRCRGRLV